MVVPGQAKKEATRIESNKPKNLLLPGTSLASVESLLMPLVHEVVLSRYLMCRVSKENSRHNVKNEWNPVSTMAMIKRIFCSSLS